VRLLAEPVVSAPLAPAAAHLRVKVVLGCCLCLLLPDAQGCLQLCFHLFFDSSIGSSHGLQEGLAFVEVVDVAAAEVAAPALLYDCCMSVKVALQSRETQQGVSMCNVCACRQELHGPDALPVLLLTLSLDSTDALPAGCLCSGSPAAAVCCNHPAQLQTCAAPDSPASTSVWSRPHACDSRTAAAVTRVMLLTNSCRLEDTGDTVKVIVRDTTQPSSPQVVYLLSLQTPSPACLQDHRCLLLLVPVLLCLPVWR
jgi:hypothetical protein